MNPVHALSENQHHTQPPNFVYGVDAANRVCEPVEFDVHCRSSAAVAIEKRVRDPQVKFIQTGDWRW